MHINVLFLKKKKKLSKKYECILQNVKLIGTVLVKYDWWLDGKDRKVLSIFKKLKNYIEMTIKSM